MAYNNGFPLNYQPAQIVYPQQNYQIPQQNYQMQQSQIPTPMQQSNDNDIHWVQGEAGAKSWLVAPGKSIMLMDSESNTFYIKSSDNSGMPMPLRIFDYTERTQQSQLNQIQTNPIQNIDMTKFVTWDELDKRLESLLKENKNQMKEVGANE